MSICCVLMSSCRRLCCVTDSVCVAFAFRYRHLARFLIGCAPMDAGQYLGRVIVGWIAQIQATLLFGQLCTAALKRLGHCKLLTCILQTGKPFEYSVVLADGMPRNAPRTTTYHNLLFTLQPGRAAWLACSTVGPCRTDVPSCRKTVKHPFDTLNQIINVILHVEQYRYG